MDELRKLREEWSAESQNFWRSSQGRTGRLRERTDEAEAGPVVDLFQALEEALAAHNQRTDQRLAALEAEVNDLRQRVRELERQQPEPPAGHRP